MIPRNISDAEWARRGDIDHGVLWDRIALDLPLDRRPGDTIPVLEVLSEVPRGRTSPLQYTATDAGLGRRFWSAWHDDEAFFCPYRTRKGWAAVLVTDIGTGLMQLVEPYREFRDLRAACDHAADLGWLIGRVPTGEWRLDDDTGRAG